MSIVQALMEERGQDLVTQRFIFKPGGQNGTFEAFTKGQSHVGQLVLTVQDSRLAIGGTVPDSYRAAAAEELIDALVREFKQKL